MRPCIYFLAMEEKQPEWYPFMVDSFEQFGVTLISIDTEQIKQLSPGVRNHVIVSESTLASKEIFDRQMASYLGFVLRSNLITVHHISSFAMRPKCMELKNKRHYHFYRMPFSIASLCSHILQQFLQDNEETEEQRRSWPGGKRARLPMV